MDVPALFAEYGDYHRSSVNRATHFVGLPLIAVGAFNLLDRIVLFDLGGATLSVGLILVTLFCVANFFVEWRLAAVMIFVAYGLLLVGQPLPTWSLWGALAAGLLIPIGGHVFYEKRWPATAGQFGRFELVGPLWFLNRIIPIVPTLPHSTATTDPRPDTASPR